MRLRGFRRLSPAIVILGALTSASLLFVAAPLARAECGTASSAPCPSPIPVNAFLSLDVTAGDPNTVINVTGGQFLPNQETTLYWDQPNKVAGAAKADGGGSFNTRVKAFSGDAPGTHKLCASVPPSPCATFSLAGPQASPSASPSPSESPSPSAVPTADVTPTSSPVAATLNGFQVITTPPFVFLPIAGGLAVALSVFYWLFMVLRRPRQERLPAAAVMHRATRPDYSAGFGTAPVADPAPPDASAWDELMPHGPPAPPPSGEESAPTSEPETPAAAEATEYSGVEWGLGDSDWGYPELTPPEDSAEAPKPGE